VKVLLAVDDSSYSERATMTLKALGLPSQTEVTVMTVVPEHNFLGDISLHMFRGTAAARQRAHKTQEERAAELLKGPVEMLRGNGSQVEGLVCLGRPAEEILNKAREIGARLIVIGAKGEGDSPRFPLGGVAQKVMKYAEASVLLAREKTTNIRRVLVATDGSKYSDEAIEFLLDLPLHPKSEVFVVTAMQSWNPALVRAFTRDWKTDQQILRDLQSSEEERAQILVTETKKRFKEKGYEASTMVLKGEPAEEILGAAETLNPNLIALGAKGLTGIEAFLLGSIAQRVARFSSYSVLIGRAQEHQK